MFDKACKLIDFSEQSVLDFILALNRIGTNSKIGAAFTDMVANRRQFLDSKKQQSNFRLPDRKAVLYIDVTLSKEK